MFYQAVYIDKTLAGEGAYRKPLERVLTPPGTSDSRHLGDNNAMPATATPLPLHEHLRRHARETPDRIAYLWYGQPLTWAQLDTASDAFAARLRA